MISVENLEIEKCYEGGNFLHVTRSINHLIRLPSMRAGPKLTSKDESYVDIQFMSLCDLCAQLILVG